MKKTLLCATALVFGAMAYGQVATAPTASTPVVNLSADPTANLGQAVQNGDDHKVKIRQAGTMQSVYTEQDNGDLSGGNLAAVTQVGAVTPASGNANAAEVRQSGDDNQSRTYQGGDLNNAVTLQGQNNASSAGNKARISQGVQQSESNYAAIEQDGDDNLASTRQTWDNNDAWTRQIGTANKSMINQNGAPEDSDGHEANNYQEGERNESAIMQSGAGGRNVAIANQIGDDNQAKQLQTTTAHTGETGNRAGVSQTFFGPISHQASRARFTIIDEVDSAAGTAGHSSLSSFGARAKQTQGGKENEADIRQTGGLDVDNSNYAEQEQASGSGNVAGMEQDWLGAGGSNYAKQYQAGDNNLSALMQNGVGLKALQDQRGDGNSALSYQSGQENLLNIHQRGDDNAATSTQHGLSNVALVVQYDGQSFIAQQNMGLGRTDLSAGNNQIDAMQLGPDGDFHDAAIECGFEDPMNLDMNYNIPDLHIDDICADC